MAAFNSGKTVERAINSILDQSFTDFELIILNDGSTDDTEEVVGRFSDERIRYFKLEHAGLTKALNYGLEQATGQIIARHDSDDWSESERFKLQMRCFDEDSSRDLVATWHNVVDSEGEYLGQKKTPSDHSSLIQMLRSRNPFCHGTVAVRKASLDAVGGYNESLLYSQDYDLWVRLEASGAKFYCVPAVLYNYSISPASIAKGWVKLANQKALRENALLPPDRREYSITSVPAIGHRRTQSLWHYAVGSLAVDDGRRIAAATSYIRSLTHDPLNWRALIRIGTIFIPSSGLNILRSRSNK